MKESSIDPKRCGVAGRPVGRAAIGEHLILDGRLALYHRSLRWLAVADLHFGYEASRRREGALWPMWGMESIGERLRHLVIDYEPENLILLGDVVDGSAASDAALAWLTSLRELCPGIVLVEGNHDRGLIRREFEWVTSLRVGDYEFDHGHLGPREGGPKTRVRGHLHPSVCFRDGAGTTLRLPSLVIEEGDAGSIEITLPAFSPWAGGGRYEPSERGRVRQWACSPQRVFEVAE